MKAIREAYGEKLRELGATNENIVVLDADVSGSTKSGLFGKEFPERFYNVGIAESNMVGMAAGFSTNGKIPFVNTFAAFMVLRGADPIRSLISYGKLNVKIAGAYAGLSDSYDGATHHAITDIAFMRAMPGMTIISVCDETSTHRAVEYAVEYDGPVYLRLSRAAMPSIYNEDFKFEVGKGVTYKDGSDLTLVATGNMVHKAIQAAELLEAEGISTRVVDIHTIKPIDKELLVKCANETKAILTCEEHNIIGGLGSAVAEVLAAERTNCPIGFIGIQDTFTRTGDYEQLLEYFGLQAKSIVAKAKELLA